MVKWTNAGGQTKRANERSFVYRPPAWRRWRNVKTTYCQLTVNVYYTDRNLLDYLLLNLAIADSSTVIFLSPKYIFSHTFSHPEGSLGNALCIAVTGGNIGWVGAVTSVFCLVAIAAERYYAVVHPIKYMARPLRKRNLKVRLLQFIVNTVLAMCFPIYWQQTILTRKIRVYGRFRVSSTPSPPWKPNHIYPLYSLISKQVIITCTWILGVIFNIPSFIYRRYNEEKKYCINTWPSEWVGKAYSLSWLLLAVLSTSLMAVLYFRVAYTMWFKKEEHPRESNLQRRVRWSKTVSMGITVKPGQPKIPLVNLFFNSLNLTWISSKQFYLFKDFHSDRIQRSSRKMFTAYYVCRNADLNLTPASYANN